MLTNKSLRKRRITRILLRIFIVIIALLLAFIIAINIPTVQTFIAQKFINSIRERTGRELSIGSVKITFPQTIVLTDIYIQDQHADTLLYLHSLKIDANLLSLFENKGYANNLSLENVVVNLHRKKSESKFNFQFILDAFSSPQTDTITQPSTPWSIQVKDLSLKDVRFSFIDEYANTDVRVNLSDFEGSVNNLAIDKKLLDLDKFILKNASVKIVSTQSGDAAQFVLANVGSNTIATNEKKKIPNLFPGWSILINLFSLKNTNFQYDDTGYPKLPEGFDSRHMLATNINTGIHNIDMSDDGLKGEIKNLSFSEGCGFDLKKFGAAVRLTEQVTELNNLIIETSRSKLSGDAKLSFSSFNDLIVNTGNSEGALDLKYADINTEDVFLLEHTLSTDSFFGKFRNSDVSISAKANGKINDLNVEYLEVTALQKTTLKSHGKLTGLPDMEKLRFNAQIDLFSTVRPDVYQFVDSKSLGGLNLPKSIELKGTVTGKTDSLLADVQINSGYGTIDAKTFYQSRNKGADTFNIDFKARNILAGQIFRDTLLGKASISGKVGGTQKGDSLLYGSASVMIEDAQYNSYNYKNIQINARKEGDIYSSMVTSSDPNVSFELSANANLQETKKKYSASLNLSNMNLQALNFVQKDLSITTNLKVELNYAGLNNSDGYLTLVITDLTNDGKKIPIKKFDLKATSEPQGLDIQLSSDVADGTIKGNINSQNLKKTFQTAFQKYLGQLTTNDLQPGNHLSFLMNIHIPKDIINLVNPKLETLEVSKLEGNYNSDNNVLSVEMQVPKVSYSKVVLDTVSMVVSGKNESLSLDLSLSKMSYNKLQIENFRIKEVTDHGKVLSEISIRDSSGALRYLFANELEFGKGFNKLRFLPEGLILDGKAWSIDPENLFVRQKNPADSQSTYSIRQFVFTRDNQSFGMITEDGNQKVEFKNFALENITDIAEFQRKDLPRGNGEKFIRGNLDGTIAFPSFVNFNGINANLAINDLYILDTLVGRLALNIKAGNNKMDVDAGLESDENKLRLSGVIEHLSESPSLNLNAQLDISNLHRLEHFSFGTLSAMNGKIDGKISLKGTTQKPEIDGYIGFDETSFRINSLNFVAKIKQEKITLNNKRIHFDDFEIEDALEKKLIVNGDILINTQGNYGLDLNLVSKNFQPINSTAADNKVFYGKLSMSADVKLKGDLKKPKIEADIKIDSATSLTYALPGSELKLISSEGIVQFLDSSKAFDTSATAHQGDYMTDSIMSKFKGINLKAHIEIEPGAKFSVDIDPKSGDYLTLNGSAKLDIATDASGKQSVNGIYEVHSGYYQLSFYDLVKKKFIIKPGSTIAWSGRPMDGDMNITAEYVVRASSVALVANETSSMSDEEKKIFNKRLPYEVKLNIRGLISKPEISFNITLPNQYMSDNPLVAAKLTQINSEEMTSQLNKQVFALLVTGSFMAENPMATTGSSTGNIASTAARNSVNGILSNQLNNMSSKYISGIDVNFGLTSYEDYSTSSGDTRTEMDIQVSKKLFNDRLTVEAENSYGLKKDKNTSGTNQQAYGQFAVIYGLTETGEYRLRAYYQNAYDPFDGDISYSGVALIFEKEFDSLKRDRSPAVAKPGEVNK